MSKAKWDVGMTDEEFVVLSEPFFKHQIWTLHDGVCLFCKLDPAQKKPPVGSMPQDPDCPTSRTYKMCLVAINHHKGISNNSYNSPTLEPLYENPQISDATDIQVDPRVFIPWASKKWPDGCSHLVQAEKGYQFRKAKGKEQAKINKGKKQIDKWSDNSSENKEEVKKAFWEMVKANELDVNNPKRKVWQWTIDLNETLSETTANPYSLKTVYVWVREWIEENQEYQEISKK